VSIDLFGVAGAETVLNKMFGQSRVPVSNTTTPAAALSAAALGTALGVGLAVAARSLTGSSRASAVESKATHGGQKKKGATDEDFDFGVSGSTGNTTFARVAAAPITPWVPIDPALPRSGRCAALGVSVWTPPGDWALVDETVQFPSASCRFAPISGEPSTTPTIMVTLEDCAGEEDGLQAILRRQTERTAAEFAEAGCAMRFAKSTPLYRDAITNDFGAEAPEAAAGESAPEPDGFYSSFSMTRGSRLIFKSLTYTTLWNAIAVTVNVTFPPGFAARLKKGKDAEGGAKTASAEAGGDDDEDMTIAKKYLDSAWRSLSLDPSRLRLRETGSRLIISQTSTQVNAAISLPFPRQFLLRDGAFRGDVPSAFDFGAPANSSACFVSHHCSVALPFGAKPQWLHLRFFSVVSTSAAASASASSSTSTAAAGVVALMEAALPHGATVTRRVPALGMIVARLAPVLPADAAAAASGETDEVMKENAPPGVVVMRAFPPRLGTDPASLPVVALWCREDGEDELAAAATLARTILLQQLRFSLAPTTGALSSVAGSAGAVTQITPNAMNIGEISGVPAGFNTDTRCRYFVQYLGENNTSPTGVAVEAASSSGPQATALATAGIFHPDRPVAEFTLGVFANEPLVLVRRHIWGPTVASVAASEAALPRQEVIFDTQTATSNSGADVAAPGAAGAMSGGSSSRTAQDVLDDLVNQARAIDEGSQSQRGRSGAGLPQGQTDAGSYRWALVTPSPSHQQAMPGGADGISVLHIGRDSAGGKQRHQSTLVTTVLPYFAAEKRITSALYR
jgi:hypothetical protein